MGIGRSPFSVNSLDIQSTAVYSPSAGLCQWDLIIAWKYTMFVVDVRLENY